MSRLPAAGIFTIGLTVGVGISFAVWAGGWNSFTNSRHQLAWILAVIAAKVVLGTGLSFTRVRPAGFGLLISVGVGCLIFFGVCSANFQMDFH